MISLVSFNYFNMTNMLIMYINLFFIFQKYCTFCFCFSSFDFIPCKWDQLLLFLLNLPSYSCYNLVSIFSSKFDFHNFFLFLHAVSINSIIFNPYFYSTSLHYSSLPSTTCCYISFQNYISCI